MKVEHVYAYVLFLFLFFFPYQPNCTELPKELRQLADIQKLRREKAVKEYRINEDGLLIRPVVELNDRNPQKDETLWSDRDCLPPDEAVCQTTSFNGQDLLHQWMEENHKQVSSL